MRQKGWWVLVFLVGSLLLVACQRNNELPEQTGTAPVIATPQAAEGAAEPEPSLPGVLEGVLADFLLFVPKLLSALVIFVVALYLANLIGQLVRRVMERRRLDPGSTLLTFLVTRWGIIILGTIYALRQVEFELTAFLAGLGILGFTVGFALQDISKNIVAGLLLLVHKPFEMGDLIMVGDYVGNVLSVDLRSTELRTRDGHNVLIPNAQVFTTPIINYNRQATWRIGLDVGVAYDSDLQQVEQVALAAVYALPDVLDNPPPNLFFHTFNSSSIDFTLHYWIDSRVTNPFTATHPAIIALRRAFDKNDIEIPYPIQTAIQIPGKARETAENKNN